MEYLSTNTFIKIKANLFFLINEHKRNKNKKQQKQTKNNKEVEAKPALIVVRRRNRSQIGYKKRNKQIKKNIYLVELLCTHVRARAKTCTGVWCAESGRTRNQFLWLFYIFYL